MRGGDQRVTFLRGEIERAGEQFQRLGAGDTIDAAFEIAHGARADVGAGGQPLLGESCEGAAAPQ